MSSNGCAARKKWCVFIALICCLTLPSCASSNMQLQCGDCCVKAITAAFDVGGEVRTGWYNCGTQLHSQAVKDEKCYSFDFAKKRSIEAPCDPICGAVTQSVETYVKYWGIFTR